MKNTAEYRIACVIVTYNRKTLLKRCLDAVHSQSLKPVTVYITDNASSDGTIDSVKEWGYFNSQLDGIEYKYVLNEKNEGGSGGFYLGMKTAFENGRYDALWVMDDDGEPDKYCLEILTEYLDKYDYIAPIVLSDIDHDSTCFTWYHEPAKELISSLNPHDGIIDNYSNPFNGILYSSKYIEVVGYPKKDMFIWGDEINYRDRGYVKGFKDVTVVRAKHYHPLGRKKFVLYRNETIAEVEHNWKLYCFLRNHWYNKIHVWHRNTLRDYYQIWLIGAKYIEYYKKILKRNIVFLVVDAYFSAIFGYFGGLKKYRWQ